MGKNIHTFFDVHIHFICSRVGKALYIDDYRYVFFTDLFIISMLLKLTTNSFYEYFTLQLVVCFLFILLQGVQEMHYKSIQIKISGLGLLHCR